jgi:hypothetical protein
VSISDSIASPTVHAVGLGKLGIAQASGIVRSWGSFGAGVAMALPTATNSAFGANDIQVGPAMFGYLSAIPSMSLVMRTLFATGSSPPLVTVLEPVVTVELSDTFALTSNGQIAIDWFAKAARVPVNLRAGASVSERWYVEAGPEIVVAGPGRGELTLDLEVDYFL